MTSVYSLSNRVSYVQSSDLLFALQRKRKSLLMTISSEGCCGFMDSWRDHFCSFCLVLQRDSIIHPDFALCFIILWTDVWRFSLNSLKVHFLLHNANMFVQHKWSNGKGEHYCCPLRNKEIGSSTNGYQRAKEDVDLRTILLQITAF